MPRVVRVNGAAELPDRPVRHGGGDGRGLGPRGPGRAKSSPAWLPCEGVEQVRVTDGGRVLPPAAGATELLRALATALGVLNGVGVRLRTEPSVADRDIFAGRSPRELAS